MPISLKVTWSMMAADVAKLAAAAGLPNTPRPKVAARREDRNGTLQGRARRRQHESPADMPCFAGGVAVAAVASLSSLFFHVQGIV
jgi:hypothetical protein